MDDNSESDTEDIETRLRHHGRRRWLIFGAVVLVVVAGAVIALELDDPEEPVKRFLDAALDRDVDDALAEVLPETVKRIRSADSPDLATDFEDADLFLNHEAIRTDWSYGSVSVDGNVVTAELTGFGKTETASFGVTDTDDGWKLRDPFVYVEVPVTSLTYLNIDGVRVEDPLPNIIDPRPAFPVFPGTHRFFDRLPKDVEVGASGSTKALLVPKTEREPVTPELGELTLTGDLAEEAQLQTDILLDHCVDTNHPYPELDDGMPLARGCPFEMEARFELGDDVYGAGSVLWQISAEPKFEFRDYRAKDEAVAVMANGFEAVVTDPGQLNVSGKALGRHGTRTTLEYRFTCEFAPEGIRGRLDEDGTFAMRALPLDGEPMLIDPDNKDCQYEHWVS